MELSEIKRNLEEYQNHLNQIRGLFDLENKETNIQEYEEMMTDPDFWNDQTKAQDIIDKNNALKSIVNGYYQLTNAVDDMSATRELLQEEYDEDMKIELEEEVQQFEEQIDQYELQLLLDGPHDANNAILELHPGAGGTESQDWVSMLLRMYQRYCEQNGFKVETVDYLPGDEAGVKSVTLLIKGHNAYGYLKAEKGVHRLVRIYLSIHLVDAILLLHHVMLFLILIMMKLKSRLTQMISQWILLELQALVDNILTKLSLQLELHHPTGIVVNNQNERSQIKIESCNENVEVQTLSIKVRRARARNG